MCTPARTPTSARTRRGLSDVPLDVFALCLDELDPVDLGRLACVSRAFNDALKTPSNWNRKAAKSLCTDEYGPLPGNIARAIIARQHVRDRKRRTPARGTPSESPSEKKRPSWQDDWSLPLCPWLNEPRSAAAKP